MQSYALEAVLKVRDEMSDALNRATRNVNNMGSSFIGTVKQGALLQVGMRAVNAGISQMSSSMGSAVSRFDTLNQFPKMMKQMGFSAKDAQKSTDSMVKAIDGLPTSLDDITGTTQQLALLTGNLKGATKTSIALNDAFLASGASAYDASRGMTQYSQMLASGKVDGQSWRTLNETMGYALTKVAKTFGYTGSEAKQKLYTALRKGEIKFSDFNKRLIQLDGGAKGFAKTARVASVGIATSFANIRTAVTSGVEKCIRAFDELLKNSGFDGVALELDGFKENVKTAFTFASESIKKANLDGFIKGITPWLNILKTTMGAVGAVAVRVGRFINNNAEVITKLVPAVYLAVRGFTLMKKAMMFVGALNKMNTIFQKWAGGILKKLVPQLTAEAIAQEEVGATATLSASQMLAFGGAIMMIGAGVLIASAGLFVMAKSAVMIGNAGVGAGVAMLGMVVAIGLLMVLVSTLGVALQAGAVGMILFGVGVMLVGAGILIASVGIKMIASYIQTIAIHAVKAGAGLILIAGGCMLLIAPALLATIALGILGVTAGISSLGMGLLAVATLAVATSVGSIANKSKSALASMQKMQSTVSVTSAGMSALKSKASGAWSALTSAVKSSVSTVKSSTNQIVIAMNNAGDSARLSGRNMGRGFIEGMLQMESACYNAGARLARASNRGYDDTADIHSPSRVAMRSGRYFGEGLVVGINSMESDVYDASKNLANMANVGASSFNGKLNTDYQYGIVSEMNIPLYVDGKEFARATARYTQTEISKSQSRSDRRKGIR